VGAELYLRCRIGAHGSAAPDAVTLLFRVDGAVVREIRVPVRIGAPVSIGEYWTPAAPGAHEVACEVNGDRKTDDSASENNTRRLTVDVRPRGAAVIPTTATASAPAPATWAAKTARPAPPAAASAPPASTAATAATNPAPAPAPPAAKSSSGPGTASTAKPDLAILAVSTAADPGCARKDPAVTVHVTLKNIGEGAFVPRNAAVLEVTAKIVGLAQLAGRKPVPQLAPGATAELDVVAKSRASVAGAAGLRYSVVVIVNGQSAVEEVTLDNNAEYIKAAAFPSC
jgi:hypothetical protein